MKKWTITEKRVEQWETEYTVKELGITGSEQSGLIQALATEVDTLRKALGSPVGWAFKDVFNQWEFSTRMSEERAKELGAVRIYVRPSGQ